MTAISAFIEIMATVVEGITFWLYSNDVFTGRSMDRKMLVKGAFCLIFHTVIITLCNSMLIVSEYTMLIAVLEITVINYILFGVNIKYCFIMIITLEMMLGIIEMFLICVISVITGDTSFIVKVLTFSNIGRILYVCFDKILNIIIYFILRKRIRQIDYRIMGNCFYIASVVMGAIMVFEMMSLINENSVQTLQLGIAVMFIVFAAMIILVIYSSDSLFKNKIKLKEQNYINYKNELLEESLRNTSKLYEENSKNFHDFKNHILTLNTMLENKQYDRTREYISNIAAVESYKPEFFTENEIINIVLNVKKEEIKRNGIIFEAAVDSKAGLNISDSDMCSLLSNIIDNAVEGCKKSDEKYIRLVIKQQGNMTIISALNSCAENPIENNFKTIKNGNHGWGMKIINDVAEKYNGQVISEYKNGEFGIKVLAPCGQSSLYA